MKQHKERYSLLCEHLTRRGIDVHAVKDRLKAQVIELPSWAVGNSGTRYGTFADKGAAVTVWDRIDDCAEIQRCLGITPRMATHVCWDKTDDGNYIPVKQYAVERGLQLGTLHPNTFSGQEFRFGSMCSPLEAVREQTKAHFEDCVRICRELNCKTIGMWVADGTNYPGQDHLRKRKHRLYEGLKHLYDTMDEDMTLLLEYKPFEPFFYTTDVSDWGISHLMCTKLGERAKVLVDLGHHLPGVNVEHIIATLLDEGRLGGFHFNNHKYADDDLILGTVNPMEIYMIYKEIVDAETEGIPTAITYMLDQSHNIENSIEGIIYSVMNIQTAYAKALIIDRAALKESQAANDTIMSSKILMEAFETDVQPLIEQVRIELGLSCTNPLLNYRRGGHQAHIEATRGAGALTLGGGC